MDPKVAQTNPKTSKLGPKVPPSTNSRGRVLAEDDVDPAAGSPKEPFRLSVEVLGELNNEHYE